MILAFRQLSIAITTTHCNKIILAVAAVLLLSSSALQHVHAATRADALRQFVYMAQNRAGPINASVRLLSLLCASFLPALRRPPV
jgi:hypothetical protein